MSDPGSEYDFHRIPDMKKGNQFLLHPPETKSHSTSKEHTPSKSKYFLATQLSGTMPTSKSINHQHEPNFDGDIEEETEKSLRRRNESLREELKQLSVQLTDLLSKQRPVRPVHTPNLSMSVSSHHGVNSEEMRLQMQLETAQKQLSNYQKEHNHLINKTEDYLDPMKRIQATEKAYEADEKIEKATAGNRQLNQLIRERGKEIEQLQKELANTRIEANMNDMMVAMTRKYRETISNQNKLKEQAEHKESYIYKLEDEIMKIKEKYQFAVQRTGYEKPTKKRISKAKSVSRFKKLELDGPDTPIMTPRNISSTWKQREDGCDDMEYNVENFGRLQNKMKVVKKSYTVKERAWRREINNLHGQIVDKDKERQEAKTSLLEVEREIEILNSVFKELNMISLKHNTQLPSKKMLQIKKLDDFGSSLLSSRTKEKIHLPQISARSHKSEMKPKIQKIYEEKVEKKPIVQKAHEEKVEKKPKVQKVNHIEKHEKGDQLEFNDRDLIKNQSVKIVGMRVWYDLKTINGIQALYQTYTGMRFEGKKHGLNHYKYRVAKFEMEGDEYLKDLTGYFNTEGTAVVCLVFKSSTGDIRKVGQTPENGRLFKFDVGENEFPAIIYGSIIEENNESILSRLGVLIGSEEAATEQVRTNEEAELFDSME